ncbi:hypothetical protein [Cystobacter fuscus]|uniref:hypothetical protein n=1 Tax=Cystobacter fuscus TaxID=43 RepID=UPI002B2E70DA|nr:hypothetical protein F0U63_28180 [Cystobacter fuscus]
MTAPRLRAFFLLLLPWGLATLGLNALFGGDVVHQLWMMGAPSVPGTILSSSVLRDSSREEAGYKWVVHTATP